MKDPVASTHNQIAAMRANGVQPACIAEYVAQRIQFVSAEAVEDFAREYPDNAAVQRLLILHENTSLELIAGWFERAAADPESARLLNVLGGVHNRLLDILPHERARKALVRLAGLAGQQVSLRQLLAFIEDESEVATLLAALAATDEGRARSELEARWPEAIPPAVYAILLESASPSFRLWLIERARTALRREPPSKALRR